MIHLEGEHERALWHDALIAALTRSESGAAEVADEAVRAYRERTRPYTIEVSGAEAVAEAFGKVSAKVNASRCPARKKDQGLVTVCELAAGHAGEHVGGEQMARRAWT